MGNGRSKSGETVFYYSDLERRHGESIENKIGARLSEHNTGAALKGEVNSCFDGCLTNEEDSHKLSPKATLTGEDNSCFDSSPASNKAIPPLSTVLEEDNSTDIMKDSGFLEPAKQTLSTDDPLQTKEISLDEQLANASALDISAKTEVNKNNSAHVNSCYTPSVDLRESSTSVSPPQECCTPVSTPQQCQQSKPVLETSTECTLNENCSSKVQCADSASSDVPAAGDIEIVHSSTIPDNSPSTDTDNATAYITNDNKTDLDSAPAISTEDENSLCNECSEHDQTILTPALKAVSLEYENVFPVSTPVPPSVELRRKTYRETREAVSLPSPVLSVRGRSRSSSTVSDYSFDGDISSEVRLLSASCCLCGRCRNDSF